jgi:hypothetical protein
MFPSTKNITFAKHIGGADVQIEYKDPEQHLIKGMSDSVAHYVID